MANPTPVNNQITDAVTQTNPQVVKEAPAVVIGNLYQTLVHSTGLMFENSVSTQQQISTLSQAAITQGVIQIYSIDTVADAMSVWKMLSA